MDRAPEASSTIMSATDRRPVAGRAGEGGRGRRSVATQLAQMLAARSPTIYAFEPVPTTFAKLVQSVHRLGLNDRVHPIAAAVLDNPRQVCLSYCEIHFMPRSRRMDSTREWETTSHTRRVSRWMGSVR
jgi:hypothetical protein